eukprot:scaffold807_cov246-Pinguiococcus_pyrenoidosus.AAC.4
MSCVSRPFCCNFWHRLAGLCVFLSFCSSGLGLVGRRARVRPANLRLAAVRPQPVTAIGEGEDEIKEVAALDMLGDLYCREVALEDGGEAAITFVRRGDPKGPKIMLLHGKHAA